MQPEIHLIAAIAENGAIGLKGQLPWHLPDDLKRFKSLTMGKAVVFGRTTWEGIGRPLPGRHVIVLSQQTGYTPSHGAALAATPQQALQLAQKTVPDQPVMVAGGAQVYAVFLPLATQLTLTHIHQTTAGDTFFPQVDLMNWQQISQEPHPGTPAYTYTTYRRP